MKNEILARDIMSPNPFIVSPNESIYNVIGILNAKKIWGIYIVEDNKVLGIFTKSDIYRCKKINKQLPIKKVMSQPAYSITPNIRASEIMPILIKLNINGIAVIENEKLIGVITKSDIGRRYLTRRSVIDENVKEIKRITETDYKEQIPSDTQKQKTNKDTLISKITKSINNIMRGIGMMSNNIKSGISHREIAKIVSVDPYKDLVSTKLIVSPTESALVIENGQIKKTLSSGTTLVGGLLNNLIGLSKKDVEIIFVSTSPYEYRWTIKNLWTKDEKSLDLTLKIEFYVSDPEKFYKQILATEKLNENKTLILDDFIKDRISDEIFNYVLTPILSKMESKDIIFGEEFQEKIKNKMSLELSKIFEKKGMKLEDSIFTPYSLKTTEILEIKQTAGQENLKEDIGAEYRIKGIKRTSNIRDIESEEELKEILRKNKIDTALLDSELDKKKLEINIKALDIEKEKIEVEIKKINLEIVKLHNEISEFSKDKDRSHELKLGEIEIRKKEAEIKAKEDLLSKILDVSSKLTEIKRKPKNYIICPSCNNRLKESAKFCSECGSKL